MGSGSHFWGPKYHLIILGSRVRVALFQYAFLTVFFINGRFLIYNCLVVYLAYKKLKNQAIPYSFKLQIKTTFGEISKNIQKAIILLSMIARSQSVRL